MLFSLHSHFLANLATYYTFATYYIFATYHTFATTKMVYALNYRRPPLVHSARASVSGDEKAKSIGESVDSGITASSGSVSFGIPEALSFDRILSGGTCPVSRLSFDHFYILQRIYTSRPHLQDPFSSVTYHESPNIYVLMETL